MSLMIHAHQVSLSANTVRKGLIHRSLPNGREYLLNVPDTYTHGSLHPLVISFHGAGYTPQEDHRISQLSTPGYEIGGLPYLVAHPQGVNNTDLNMTNIWQGAPYGNKTVDDVQFVKDIIQDISRDYTVNPRRFYACGFSNGGGLTALLACRSDTAKIFAAFAPVSPALYAGTCSFSGCEPGRPVPILHCHGIVDPVTPFHGALEGQTPHGAKQDVRIWRAEWAKRNGCRSKGALPEPSSKTHPYPNTTLEVWDCETEIRALSIDNLGHAWPTIDGLDERAAPNNTASFDFTSAFLLDFFSSHQLPEEILSVT